MPYKILIEEVCTRDGNITSINIDEQGAIPFSKGFTMTMDEFLDQNPFLKGVVEAAEEIWRAATPVAAAKQPEIRQPSGKTMEEMVKIGDRIRTNYDTGGIVIQIKTYPFQNVQTYSLTYVLVADYVAGKTKYHESKYHFLNELVAVDGRILKLFKANTDEVFVDETPSTQASEPGVPESEKRWEPVETVHVTQDPVTNQNTETRVKHRTSAKNWQYLVASSPNQAAGPFETLQEAFDALGLDKATRPTHNRYDRLRKKLQKQIIQERKPN